MSINEEKVCIKTVNSSTIDDPWVICNSTSHPGLKFYVNQRTGIKVWNITEPEIAYAEKAVLGGPEPQSCPTMNHPKKETIYSKQIINNQFSNQLSNVLVNTVPVCSVKVWDNPQNQPTQSYTLVPTAIAEAYSRLIPLPNNMQNANLQMGHNTQQNQPLRWTSRSRWRRPMGKWSRDNELTHSHNKTDLREKLVRRQSFSESYNGNEQDVIIKEETNLWKVKNRNEQNWEETSVQMSLAPLKLLTSPYSDTYKWYIVVDADVILKNYNFLNNMATADPDCQLLVPHHVISELRVYVSESNNVQARRVLRFLTQQIESGLALLGKQVTGESACHMTIKTCLMLASQNIQVVLISNNTETFYYKTHGKNVHVFTMQNIKDILANKSKKLSRPISPTLAVKIVVPNNAKEMNVTSQDSMSSSFSETPSLRSNYSQDISGINYQKIFDETECANDIRDISGIVSQKHIDSTKLANDSRYTTENAYDTRDISGTNFRRTSTSTRTNDTRNISEPNYLRTSVSTKLTNDAREISGANSQRKIDSAECAYEFQGFPGTNLRPIKLTEPVSDKLRSFFDTPEHANDLRNISETNSQRTFDSTECVIDTQAVSETISRRTINSAGQVSGNHDISEIFPRNIDSANLANNVRDFRETTSRGIFDTAESDHGPRTKTIKDNNNCNQNLSNSTVQAKELAGTSVCTKNALKAQSEHFNADCIQSPAKSVPESGNKLFDTGGTTFLGGTPKKLESPKNDNQKPSKMSHMSSPSTSSTSGHVSLDTIGMKRIISMRRLTSTTDDSLDVYNKPTRSISSNKSQRSIMSTEILPLSRSASRLSCDNTSESSAVKINVSENVIVEETSTSGMISNTSSDSSHFKKVVLPIRNNVSKKTRNSFVKFEVAGQSMEDILRTRLDEWLFRFVQIMEEVLRVKLQEKLPFEEKEYPAPRDLQEATTCIINKYIENFNIIHAANNLSYILYKTGDEKGKMADNIQPSQYMEMYSYGVFLVETFVEMSAECKEKDCKTEKSSRTNEDNADTCSCYEVKNASESLKKLLYDIQNANQESFVDHPHDISMENLHLDSDFQSDPHDDDIGTKEDNMSIPEIMKSPNDYEEPKEMQCDDHSDLNNSCNKQPQRRKSQSVSSSCNQRPQGRKSESVSSSCNQRPQGRKSESVSSSCKQRPQRRKSQSVCSSCNQRSQICKSQSVSSSCKLQPHTPKSVTNSYNLRAQRRVTLSQKAKDEVPANGMNANKGIEVTFFNSLHLQRNEHVSDLKNDAAEEKTLSHTTDQVQTTDEREKEQNLPIKIHLNKDPKKSPFNSKIVFNFTKNPDIERKIKARQSEKECESICDNEEGSTVEQPAPYESEHNDCQEISDLNENSRFIQRLAHNLKIFFTKMHSLCHEYILMANEQSNTRIERHNQLEEWCARIGCIHYALDSILKQEKPMNEDIQTMLKKIANVDYIPDDKLFLENRECITVLKQMAEEFYKRLRRILNYGSRIAPGDTT